MTSIFLILGTIQLLSSALLIFVFITSSSEIKKLKTENKTLKEEKTND